MLYYTMLPHGLIPPLIKRSRIMVISGVVIAKLGKILIELWLPNIFVAARTLLEILILDIL